VYQERTEITDGVQRRWRDIIYKPRAHATDNTNTECCFVVSRAHYEM